jgi:ABC-type xylose transport system permease subunit
VQDFGVAVSAADAAQIERTGDAIAKLSLIWLGLTNRLTAAVAPALEKVANALADMARGTALMGGRGTIIGTVIGIFILRLMRNGIVLIGVPGLAYNIFIGAIILGMMALHTWLERRHNTGT